VPETTLVIVTGALLVISVVAPSLTGWIRERIRLTRVRREVQRLSTSGQTSA
jgi:rhamnose transport system permease protein